ncbi:FecR family protein [Sediminibacterium soli]|uniref:FecR family protein n=1 Tax=Sediminibacterium soli TaxID=2698829 RepID=UPI0013796131|nr:FecR family protein [Sediminibacterium soli]NCI46467.1 DUF4974 domain-containing protein [Sediminibacterium soli]
MRKPDNGLPFLFRQYLAGTLGSEERQLFLQQAASKYSEDALKELIDQEIALLEPGASMAGNHLTEAQADLIFDHVIGQSKLVSLQRRKRLVWMGSVAAALVALFVGIYYFSQPAAGSAPAVVWKPASQDVAPGTTGAVLTLANGKKILLDSLHNGNIASQGQASITKENNGIAYHAANGQTAVEFNTLSTPRARQFQLSLPDGTKVWLNAASSITYPTAFTGQERTVTVTGETYFEVTPNKKLPFFVRYRDKKVEVLGTHFNVNAYDEENESRVTLLEGAVTVHNGNDIGQLVPGQQAVMGKTSGIHVRDAVDVDQVMAWKNGQFDFRDTDLKTLMRQLMRWYDVDVSYQQGVPERFFTADVSRDKNLSSVLKILELNKIHFKIEDKKIIVTP